MPTLDQVLATVKPKTSGKTLDDVLASLPKNRVAKPPQQEITENPLIAGEVRPLKPPQITDKILAAGDKAATELGRPIIGPQEDARIRVATFRPEERERTGLSKAIPYAASAYTGLQEFLGGLTSPTAIATMVGTGKLPEGLIHDTVTTKFLADMTGATIQEASAAINAWNEKRYTDIPEHLVKGIGSGIFTGGLAKGAFGEGVEPTRAKDVAASELARDLEQGPMESPGQQPAQPIVQSEQPQEPLLPPQAPPATAPVPTIPIERGLNEELRQNRAQRRAAVTVPERQEAFPKPLPTGPEPENVPAPIRTTQEIVRHDPATKRFQIAPDAQIAELEKAIAQVKPLAESDPRGPMAALQFQLEHTLDQKRGVTSREMEDLARLGQSPTEPPSTPEPSASPKTPESPAGTPPNSLQATVPASLPEPERQPVVDKVSEPSVETEKESRILHKVSPISEKTEISQPVVDTSKPHLIAAAVKAPDGTIWQGPHHPAIDKKLGKPITEREQRNTPSYGFIVDEGKGGKRFADRQEATEIAKASGQALEPFEEGHELHSDEVVSAFESGKTISEDKQPVVASPPSVEGQTTDKTAKPQDWVKSGKAAEFTQYIIDKRFKEEAAATASKTPAEVLSITDSKKAILAEIEKHIGAAIPENDILSKEEVEVPSGQFVSGKRITTKKPLSEVGRLATGEYDPKHKDRIVRLLEEKARKVTIDIPGDGTFKIINTKEALTAFRDRVQALNKSQVAPIKTPTASQSKLAVEKQYLAELEQIHRDATGEHRVDVTREMAETEARIKALKEGQNPSQEKAVTESQPTEQKSVEAPKPAVEPPTALAPSEALHQGQKIKLPKGANAVLAKRADGKYAKALSKDLDTLKDGGPYTSVKALNVKMSSTGAPKWNEAEEVRGKIEVGTSKPVEVLGFGGKGSVIADEEPMPTTPEKLSEIIKRKTPGLEILHDVKTGISSLLLPTAKSSEHLTAAEELGAKLGELNRRAEVSASQLRPSDKMFNRLGLDRADVSPRDNPGIKFMSDMSQGRPLTGKFKLAADLIRKEFDKRLAELEKVGAEPETVRSNYFPGMWTSESRLAFNAAMEDALKEGIIKEGFDVNDATPEQKAWVKKRADELIDENKGSEKDMLSYLTRRPMQGRESFRKQKVFDDIMTGAEFGLRPVSHNPIDIVKLKLAEMDKSILLHQYSAQLKELGKEKVVNPYEEIPEGWERHPDKKHSTIYGPPTVEVSEHIDKAVYEGLLKVAKDLGIEHTRTMQTPPGKGTPKSALGLSYQGANKIWSRFGTETSVIAHEIGHQLDVKYDLWKNLLLRDSGKSYAPGRSELRNIADLTGDRGGNPRSKEEKIAQVLEAYIHAPEKMKEVAPRVFDWFDQFVASTPELASLAEIRPGIELKELTAEKYVGLPIVGYRIVPIPTADIIRNYLSSSLYNNRYFGKMYKGWMGAANTINQYQLGLGSGFHAGFTTGEVQVSAGANLIKDVYGVLRGNRSVSDLTKTTKNWVTAMGRTMVDGDKVLNAWRNPDGVIDPHIKQIVRAAELAGGGFKMEHGLLTEQTDKVVRDWYSGNKVKAATRSPIAATELMAKPIMEWLVPRQKAGVFADLASRIIEQNPETPLEDLAPQFRQAWNRTDSRLGQVRYQRLFLNNTAKNVVQSLVRAPGWSGGTIAELGGAFKDAGEFMSEWATTGKLPENIPDRTAYAISLLTTVGILNGALTYAFTGTMPQGMDYFAFRDGGKDKDGNATRFLLPTYMKDVLSYSLLPVTTLEAKAHPMLVMLDDILRKNKDYYGTEIRHPGDSAIKQAGQIGKYVVKNFEPFWIRGAQKIKEEGSGIGKQALAYIGIMPAPGYITKSKMQLKIDQVLHDQIRVGDRTEAKAESSQWRSQIATLYRKDPKAADAKMQELKASGKLTELDEENILKRESEPDSDVAKIKLITRPVHAMEAFRLATDAEKARIYDAVYNKVDNSRKPTEAEKDAWRNELMAEAVRLKLHQPASKN